MATSAKFDPPKAGRKYRIVDVIEVTRADDCEPPCVTYKHSNGNESYSSNPENFDWIDLGPALEEGFYQDVYGEFWFLRGGKYWVLKGRRGHDRFSPVPDAPCFPIRKVTVGDEEIRE